ncbi:hypothetical protein K504DRAFT_374061 [Pleomassaria siparia CBS 279.74]|uniref:Inheritance of peroxisomes protein 1 n=1 Tax=Pleomassaria siparia CBS 279.74 TaxID=1314801 RepID=A0A6G1KGR6_9PLEO|nr:hypothetical protein K504DRAFT_374061 [Pleomassaria siparia CBS 279.74]
MESPAPKTPEQTHALAPAASNPNLRRAFTLPSRIIRPRASTTSPSPASADGIETLFTHTCNKIVSFTIAGTRMQPISSRRQSIDVDADKTGTLPWKSTTERTLTVGALRIYRVTSSNVSFLNSGSLLHTIFPRSQCWCVDAESKFVLRIRQDSYYRIELPCESEEDREKLDEFRAVLDQVLQYEKTPCPFRRRFEVQLPEPVTTPTPRKRAQQPPEKAKKWLFDKTWMPDQGPRPSTPVLGGSDSGSTSSHEDGRSSINTNRREATLESLETADNVTPLKRIPQRTPSLSERAQKFQGARSMTLPVGRGMDFSKMRQQPGPLDGTEDGRKQSTDNISMESSTDSFHTPGQLSPSPPYLDAEVNQTNPWEEELNPRMSRKDQHARGRSRRRRYSEATVRAPSFDPSEEYTSEEYSSEEEDPEEFLTATWVTSLRSKPNPNIAFQPSSAPSTPPLVSDREEDSLPTLDVATPPEHIRMKRLTGASQRRAFSPMPSPHNLFLPTSQGPRKQLTAALIRKTYELVLGPPHHLVTLMLRIAANIKNGAFGFTTYRIRQEASKIPGSWDSDQEWSEDEDDFGIPLRSLRKSTSKRRGASTQRGARGCSSGVD